MNVVVQPFDVNKLALHFLIFFGQVRFVHSEKLPRELHVRSARATDIMVVPESSQFTLQIAIPYSQRLG